MRKLILGVELSWKKLTLYWGMLEMKRKIFISHKTEEESNDASEAIHEALEEAGHDVFLDKASLEGGMDWREEILEGLMTSDVVILVINEETAGSNWVQREVDTARACDIAILPVVLGDYSKAKEAFDRFELGNIQLIKFSLYQKKMEKSIQEILSSIEPLAQKTTEAQQATWQEWQERRSVTAPKKKFEYKALDQAVTFKHPEIGDDIIFCIATGDATEISAYDVLANTENNYMQMARFYERKTLSWAIRTKGAHKDGETLITDTMQESLYNQVKHQRGGLPVPDCAVIPTLIGHRDSEMVEFSDFRYVFHVASVRVSLEQGKVVALEEGSNERIVRNCLELITKIDKKKGAVIYDENGDLSEEEEDYQDISSILLPIFGAGDGAKPLNIAASQIIQSFKKQVLKYQKRGLEVKKIGLSVYNFADVPDIVEIFKENGFEVIETSLD